MKTLRRLLLVLFLSGLVPAPAARAAFIPTPAAAPAASAVAVLSTRTAAPAAHRIHLATTRLQKGGVFRKIWRFLGAPTKKLWLAALLALFFGTYGLHRFYLGYNLEGGLQIGGTLLGSILVLAGFAAAYAGAGVAAAVILGLLLLLGVQVWVLIDLIRILTGDLQPKNGHYSDE